MSPSRQCQSRVTRQELRTLKLCHTKLFQTLWYTLKLSSTKLFQTPHPLVRRMRGARLKRALLLKVAI